MPTVQNYIQTRSNYWTQLNVTSIIFDSDFVTGNIITMDISGVNIGNINFTTDHDTTVGLVVTAIDNLAGVNAGLSPNDSSNRTIEVDGLTNSLVTIDNVSVTGGASQTGYTIMASRLNDLIAQATLLVDDNFCYYEQGIALIVMHWLAMAENSGSGVNGNAGSGMVKSKREGDLSITYGITGGSKSSGLEYWGLSSYGIEYYNLRKMCYIGPRNRMVP